MVAPTCPALRTVQDIEALLEATLFEFDDPPDPPRPIPSTRRAQSSRQPDMPVLAQEPAAGAAQQQRECSRRRGNRGRGLSTRSSLGGVLPSTSSTPSRQTVDPDFSGSEAAEAGDQKERATYLQHGCADVSRSSRARPAGSLTKSSPDVPPHAPSGRPPRKRGSRGSGQGQNCRDAREPSANAVRGPAVASGCSLVLDVGGRS